MICLVQTTLLYQVRVQPGAFYAKNLLRDGRRAVGPKSGIRQFPVDRSRALEEPAMGDATSAGMPKLSRCER